MSSVPFRTALLALLSLLACASCGTQEAPNGEHASGGRQTAGRPQAAGGPALKSLSFAGSLTLAGRLAANKNAAVFVSVFRAGEVTKPGAVPCLSRRYEIDDPDWMDREGGLLRYFGLSDRDRVGEMVVGASQALEIEARYDPDGVLDTQQGSIRSVIPVKNGQREIDLVVPPKAGEPTVSTPNKGG